jgi:hypothetical protein
MNVKGAGEMKTVLQETSQIFRWPCPGMRQGIDILWFPTFRTNIVPKFLGYKEDMGSAGNNVGACIV